MAIELRNTGISVVGDMPWGTHFCCFYETKEDLLDILVPYFKVGLENNEFCLWVISSSELLTVEEATSALRKALPELDRYMAEGSIEVVTHDEWFLKGRAFDLQRVVNRFKEKVDEALARGYAGMRVNGSPAWMRKEDGKELLEFEGELDRLFPNERIIASCTYPLAGSGAAELLDVTRTHQFAIVRRHGNWELIETPELKQAKAEIRRLNEELEQRVVERTRELTAANEKLKTEIAERKQVEETLRKSEAQLAEAQQLAQLGSWSRELATNVVTWSNEIFRIFGMEPQKVGTTYQAFLERVHPDDRTAVRTVIEDAFKYHRPFSCEYRITRLDGAVRIIHERGSVVVDGGGNPIRVFGTAQDITERKHAEEELRTSREQLRTLAAYLESVREEERSRMARELHDEIGQALTAIKLSLERSIRGLSAGGHANLTQALGLVNELIGQVRELSLDLRPAMLDDLGLLAALRWHFDRYTNQVKVKVDFKHMGLEERRFSPEIETAAYRIVQEALTNVARHARVDHAQVSVWADEKMLCIRIKDLGKGFDLNSLSAVTASGLSGMRERAVMLGGKLDIQSAPGAGTQLTVELPLITRIVGHNRERQPG
jgi:PAS domain S-box-containing protein